MESGYQNAISIRSAMNSIATTEYVLPSIQRKFVWKAEQIEMLFDSILQGFPMNTFMLWHISVDSPVKKENKFYGFLDSYRQWYKEENREIHVSALTKDFYAVIDGQQRLNALYIGLTGTYGYKMPRKHWADNQDAIPDRSLYLGLKELIDQTDSNNKKYDFKFLSDCDLIECKKRGEYKFPVKKLMNFNKLDELCNYLDKENVERGTFGREAIIDLYEKIHNEKLITYYLEEDSSNIDKVLDIFVRTNSGGTALSYSDLLMSMLSAKWSTIDARKSVDAIIDSLGKIIPGQFYVSRDFVMKTCLVLFSTDLKFKLSNFTPDTIQSIEQNWDRIDKCIKSVFELINTLGFNGTNLRSYNAVIPIIYYVYLNGLENQITKVSYSKDERTRIQVWLNISLLKGVFGGHSDGVLAKMRKIISSAKEDGFKSFPAKQIVAGFNGDANSYEVTDANYDDWLSARYGSNEADYLLFMLYPNLDYYNQDFHRDHMHAKSLFNSEKSLAKLRSVFVNESDFQFASDPANWNSIANLQLLNNLLNEKKKTRSLKDWASDNAIEKSALLVSPCTSLDLKDFREFIEDRRKEIRSIIENRISF